MLQTTKHEFWCEDFGFFNGLHSLIALTVEDGQRSLDAVPGGICLLLGIRANFGPPGLRFGLLLLKKGVVKH